MGEGYLFEDYLERYRKELLPMLLEGGAQQVLCSFEIWLIEEGHLPERDK